MKVLKVLTLLSISTIGLGIGHHNQGHMFAGCYFMLVRRLIIGTASIVLSIILFWIFSTDFLVFVGLVKVPPQPAQDVSASVSELEQHSITAAPGLAGFRETVLKVQYKTPIKLSEQAVISMTLTQIMRITRLDSGEPDRIDAEAIDSLSFALHLVMTSKGFDFATGEGDRVILRDTKLPFTLRWTPVAKHPGDWTLVMNLKDINQGRRSRGSADSVEVTVNGETKSYRGNDDIPFPIAVWTDFGVPLVVYEWGKLFLQVAAGLVGATGLWGFLQALVTRNKESKPNP